MEYELLQSWLHIFDWSDCFKEMKGGWFLIVNETFFLIYPGEIVSWVSVVALYCYNMSLPLYFCCPKLKWQFFGYSNNPYSHIVISWAIQEELHKVHTIKRFLKIYIFVKIIIVFFFFNVYLFIYFLDFQYPLYPAS